MEMEMENFVTHVSAALYARLAAMRALLYFVLSSNHRRESSTVLNRLNCVYSLLYFPCLIA